MKTAKWVGAVLCFSASLAQADNIIPYGTPTIDGVLTEKIEGEYNSNQEQKAYSPPEWSETSHIRMARFYGFDQFADFWLQWDKNYLYIAGQLQDYTLFEDEPPKGKTQNDDSIEIYFHPDDKLPSDPDLNPMLDENSRVLAFTITGQSWRLDRGSWDKEPTPTVGLEILGKTTAKINDDQSSLTDTVRQDFGQACPHIQLSLPQPLPPAADVKVQFVSKINGTINNLDRDQDWTFEVALPWELLGTIVGQKFVPPPINQEPNCDVGKGVMLSELTPFDGMSIRLNFYRVNDDEGGEVKPDMGEIKDQLNPDFNPETVPTGQQFLTESAPDGIMKDEWFVYQGNRNYPKEWANFVLSKQGAKETSAKPDFSNAAKFDTNKVMGDRRVRLTLTAPKSSISDKAVSRYEIRTQLGEVEVNEATWANMQTFENAYQPAQPGTPQTLDVIGLAPGQTYTIALQAFDELEQPSGKMLSTTVTLENKGTDPFVTVSPTGRSLVFTDGTPFTVVGETGLMPWLPLRGLYDGDLCDEDWSEKDNYDCGKDEKGQFIGKTRNYSKEKYFGCSDENGKVLHSILIIQQEGKDWNQLQTDCDHKGYPVVQQEGPEVAEEYFGKLKDAGVNVLTVFVESLDLKATPIFFEPSQGQYNKAALQFLKRLVDLARKYDVYLIIRLYDTFYYRKNIDTIDKWSRTYWATELHKSSPEDFFHKDLDDSHKARMKVLFDLYKQEPHILGWDLLNEVDNKARFNQANFADRKKWLEEMLVYAKGQNPFQLMFYSFLTWDPKDSDYYRADIDDVIGKEKVIDEITGKEKEVEVKMTEEDYLGMDAELAYRVPKADLAVPHGYYAHIAAPGRDATTNPDYEKPLELARGISYGFHQIRDGRPILDGEGGPSPLFIKTYEEDDRFTSEQDKDMFLNSLWLHFVSGGAGANLRWPHDMKKSATINQIPSDWRELSKVFKDTVGDIPWRGHHLKISHRERSDGIRVMTRYDGRRAVSYFYNPQKHVISTITLPELDNAWVNVKIVNPRTGEELLSQDDNTTSSFNIEGFADHLVVVVERQVAALEATNSVWSKSTNHYLDLWPKFVFPFVEEDVYFWLEDSDKKRQYITLSNDLPVLNSTRQPMYRRVTWTATFYGDLSEYRTRSFKDNDGKSITPILHIPMSGLPAGSYQVGTEIGGHVSFTKFEIED